MPLYEALMVLRALHPKETVNTLKGIFSVIFENYPSVRFREVQNLGDRVLGKKINLRNQRHFVGRYVQLIYDGPPSVAAAILRELSHPDREECLRFYVHRISDKDYINHMYMKAMRHTAPYGWDDHMRDLTFVRDFNRLEKNAKS